MSNSIKPLLLMRHAKAQISTSHCIGQWDVALTEEGIAEVQQLASHWPYKIPKLILCSDLQRTQQTAEIIANELGLEAVTDARLREINFGDWENRSWDELYHSNPELMDEWGENWLNVSPPNGENVRQLYARIELCARELTTDTLVIAHAGSLRALRCHLLGLPLKEFFNYNFQHATPVVID